MLLVRVDKINADKEYTAVVTKKRKRLQPIKEVLRLIVMSTCLPVSELENSSLVKCNKLLKQLCMNEKLDFLWIISVKTELIAHNHSNY